MSFPIKTSAHTTILRTRPPTEHVFHCHEYVILEPDTYERQRQKHGDDWVYLLPLDVAPGGEAWTEGLNCPDSYVTAGGCHRTFDWGISSHYLFSIERIEKWEKPGHMTIWKWEKEKEKWKTQIFEESREFCRSRGHAYRWSRQRPQAVDDLSADNLNLIQQIRGWFIKNQGWIIKYFPVPQLGYPGSGRAVGGVRG